MEPGLIDKLKAQGKMAFAHAATGQEIDDFEAQNNVALPAEYREWLLFSDGGDLFLPAGVQLHGVAHKPLIDAADSDRPSDSYIVIGSTSAGDPILCEKNGKRISIYNHGLGKIEDDESYADFFDFLNNLKTLLGYEQ